MTQFKVIFRHWLGRNEEYDGNINEGRWCLGEFWTGELPNLGQWCYLCCNSGTFSYYVYICMSEQPITVRSNQMTVTCTALKREWGNGVCRKVASQLRMIDEASVAVSEKKNAVLTSRRLQQRVCRSTAGRPDPNQRPRVVLRPFPLSTCKQCNMNWPLSPRPTQLSFHCTLQSRYYRQCKRNKCILFPFGATVAAGRATWCWLSVAT
jgi:hypothetical protein